MKLHSHETVTRYQVTFDANETETLLAHPKWKEVLSTKMSEHNGHRRLCGAAQLTKKQINGICDTLGVNGREFMSGVYVLSATDTLSTVDTNHLRIENAELAASVEALEADLATQRAENARCMSLVGQAMNPPAPADMRADYLAAALWLTNAGVPMLADGKPLTLGERVKTLAAQRDEAQMLCRDARIQAMDRGASYQSVVAERDAAETELRIVRESCDAARLEVERLRGLINTPRTEDFFEAVRIEAAHQVERWGVEHDAGKRAEDWLTLYTYLLGKAARAHFDGNRDKLLHHIITVAAVALNWHRNMTGENTLMRPGVAPAAVAP